jgi:hypothetical protein
MAYTLKIYFMKQEAVESFQNASVKEVFVAILRALRD